jgi:CBS domain-containing protein
MEVSHLMTPTPVSITPEESVALAARLLCRHNLGSLPVCDEKGRLLGMVTDRDIVIRCVAGSGDPNHQPVREIMSQGITTISPTDPVKEAAHLMACRQIRRLPVVEDGKLVGMLSLGDLAKSRPCHLEAGEALEEISRGLRRAGG